MWPFLKVFFINIEAFKKQSGTAEFWAGLRFTRKTELAFLGFDVDVLIN